MPVLPAGPLPAHVCQVSEGPLGLGTPDGEYKYEDCVCPNRFSLHNSPVRLVLLLLLPFCVRKRGPKEVTYVAQGHVRSLQQSHNRNPDNLLLGLSLNLCSFFFFLIPGGVKLGCLFKSFLFLNVDLYHYKLPS